MAAKGAKETEASQVEASEQRLDKWLWFARVIKSRTLAQGLVTDGKVRLNRQRVDKPSQTVRPGDVLTITVRGDVRVLKILAPGVRRGPATEAAQLFEDLKPASSRTGGASAMSASGGRDDAGGGGSPATTTASDAASELGRGSLGRREPGSGRPTKRERRELDRLTDSDD